MTSLSSLAHPVIFEGGKEFMTNYQPFFQEYNFLYSYNSKNSFGLKQMQSNKEDMTLLSYNHLMKRWNMPESQANMYLLTGIGSNDSKKMAYNLGLETDWESRRLYISGKYLNMAHSNLTRTRAGFSPYKASFKDVNTWIMVEHTKFNNQSEITPFVRFYYDFILIEIGYGLKKNLMFNTMFHF